MSSGFLSLILAFAPAGKKGIESTVGNNSSFRRAAAMDNESMNPSALPDT